MSISLQAEIARRFDPSNTVTVFLMRADERLRSLGLETFLHRDMVGLADCRDGVPLMPQYDPRCYEGGEAFWLEVRDLEGAPVATEAGRLHRLDRNLAEAMIDLSFFYNPVERASPGEWCTVSSPTAREIDGDVWFGGALYVRPAWRGRGVGGLLPHIARCLADLYWRQRWSFAVCEDDIAASAVVPAVGYTNNEPGIDWCGSASYGDQRLNLIWMNRRELHAAVARQLALVAVA